MVSKKNNLTLASILVKGWDLLQRTSQLQKKYFSFYRYGKYTLQFPPLHQWGNSYIPLRGWKVPSILLSHFKDIVNDKTCKCIILILFPYFRNTIYILYFSKNQTLVFLYVGYNFLEFWTRNSRSRSPTVNRVISKFKFHGFWLWLKLSEYCASLTINTAIH